MSKLLKERKIRPEILPYLEQILKRDKISYEVIPGEKVRTALTSAEFHNYVEEAMCKEQQGDSKIPVYSRRMLKFQKPQGVYHILKKDVDDYLKEN